MNNGFMADQKKSNWPKIVCGCILVGGFLFLIVCVGGYFGSKAFVNFGISTDVGEFIDLVKQSDLDDESKAQLVERLEGIRDDARKGRRPSFFLWLDYDESIRGLIEDGEITEEDFAALSRELDRLEQASQP